MPPIGRGAGADQPNVILCMTDDQGWGDTGYNDHPQLQTPNMDAMADDGVRFDRFYAASPVCSPTRGSCLTGRHPYRYGIEYANVGHLPAAERNLAETLSEAGYRTGHFGKWHLGTLTTVVQESNRGGPRGTDHYAPPWDRGFDTCFSTEAAVPTYDPMRVPAISDAEDGDETTVGDAYGSHYWTGPGEIATENLGGDDSRVIVDRAVPFVREAARENEPFFAVVWFHSPHAPVVAGEEDRERYAHRSVDEQHYYGTISAIDAQIGRLRDELYDLGIAEETMLWFCSDNGPAAEGGGPGWDSGMRQRGETGRLRGRKGTLYEGGVRVPGTLVWPEGVDPGVVDAPCVTTDFYPTILDAVGSNVSGPEPLDGESLLPLLRGERDGRSSPIGFRDRNLTGDGGDIAVIDDDHKLIRPHADATFQLYDLAEDPYETENLADEQPERVDELETWVRNWRASIDAEERSTCT
ncbi:sulfatase family protein [Salinarchaeum laminariae]|uniref:sulfatase family protein n=1 Tax=Salinarchaeum laminariae TaxID=869888 RepID=UPI0020BFADC5|nr:sulfatase-like hydrolase/transferase [Salinarchaeum laminariae]